ncbi:MAG: hypothetical protein H0T42_17930 [Deltaproteobacteria bacterium]|nr:hypothetical protein [Deltaproteobacteria bacterium]
MEPDAETREDLLDVLGEYVARGGVAPLLAQPVEPGDAAFPEPWAPTPSGVRQLMRRLAWHAGLDREVEIEDRRAGAVPTERKPATRVELLEVRRKSALFALGFIGEDDIAGTLAHEIGVAHAVLHRPDGVDPYRTAEAPVIAVDPAVDLERGSIATVYLGLGVLAANAARQQHSIHERTNFNPMLVTSTGVQIESGYLPVESLVYLVAVQAALRGEKKPPAGLVPTQRRQVAAVLEELDGEKLRDRLGIPRDAVGARRPAVERFKDAQLTADEGVARNAFRWNTSRKGVGTILGTVLGFSVSLIASRGLLPIFTIGGAGVGHMVGRRVRVPRCSACATVNAPGAATCVKCGAVFRGDIEHLSERLDAEERLDDS